jgi:hypothetical protein
MNLAKGIAAVGVPQTALVRLEARLLVGRDEATPGPFVVREAIELNRQLFE